MNTIVNLYGVHLPGVINKIKPELNVHLSGKVVKFVHRENNKNFKFIIPQDEFKDPNRVC